MMRSMYYIVAVLVFALVFGAGFASAEKERGRAGRFATGHVLVKFREDEVLKRVPDYRRRGMRGVEKKLGLPPGIRVRETTLAKWMKKKRGASDTEAEDMSVFMYLDLPPGLSGDDAVSMLSRNPMVEYAEKDAIGYAGAVYPTNNPDPRYFDRQWFLHGPTAEVGRIWAPEAWGITQGSSNIIVAVLDTGLNTNLDDFIGRWVPGWDFVPPVGNNPADDNDADGGHGTKVASIIGAVANDGKNGVGVDWNCKIMPVKVLDNTASGLASWWAQGTYYALSNGANVINLSAGSTESNVTLEAAIKHAVSNGVTFVTIAHNGGTNLVTFPGWMDETITVGGITKTGTFWTGGNWGTNMDLVAPSTNVFAVRNTIGLDYDAIGTSFAAPMVSGAAALLLSLDPTLDCWEIRDLLCGGAEDQISSDTNDLSGWDMHYGWGKLNIYNSMRLLLTEIDTIEAPTATNTYLSWPCTGNAETNRPYGIIWADDLTSTNWSIVSNVTYTTERAHWTGGNGGQSNRYYRTYIKRYQSSWTN